MLITLTVAVAVNVAADAATTTTTAAVAAAACTTNSPGCLHLLHNLPVLVSVLHRASTEPITPLFLTLGYKPACLACGQPSKNR